MSGQAHEGSFTMDDYESKPRQVGVRIPCGVHSQVPQEGGLRRTEAILREVFRRLALERKAGSNKVTSCRITSATPTAASSGPISKAPGSAGGYLLPCPRLVPATTRSQRPGLWIILPLGGFRLGTKTPCTVHQIDQPSPNFGRSAERPLTGVILRPSL